MTTKSLRTLRLGACAAWLVVAGYGLWESLVESGDDWELSYTVFAVALTVGAALTFCLLIVASSDSSRRPLRVVGLAVTALGVAAAFVGAWALPLWMLILGIGIALTALASDGRARRPVAILAAAQFAGMAVQFAALGIGTDEDLAANLALIVTATAMVVGFGSGFGYLVSGARLDGPAAPTRSSRPHSRAVRTSGAAGGLLPA